VKADAASKSRVYRLYSFRTLNWRFPQKALQPVMADQPEVLGRGKWK
jgi:hypothetical protein